jgi:hypothetical protein
MQAKMSLWRLKRSSLCATSIAERIVLIVMACLFLFSAFVVAHDFHDNLKNRLDCAICESAQDLSSGGVEEGVSPAPPQLLCLSFVPETLANERVIFVRSVILLRAPPA